MNDRLSLVTRTAAAWLVTAGMALTIGMIIGERWGLNAIRLPIAVVILAAALAWAVALAIEWNMASGFDGHASGVKYTKGGENE